MKPIGAVKSALPQKAETSIPSGSRSGLLQRRPVYVAVAMLFGLMALALRAFGLQRANDVFIDEVTYADIARQIADGFMPPIVGGNPFFLHPPGSFVLNALVIRVLGLEGHPMDLALQLRWVNTVLGALTVVVCFLLVRRLVGVGPSVYASIVLLSDPFVLRMDGRLMIEAPAGLAVLSGWLLIHMVLDVHRGRKRLWLEVGAGLVFGVALVMKDMTAVFTLLPLLAAVVWRRTISLKTAIRIGTLSMVPYSFYLSWIAATGMLEQFIDQKWIGVLRMVGALQVTGFNAVPGTNLTGRLLELAGRFGTSYLLLGLSILAGAVAATSPLPNRRVIGIFSLAAGCFGAYSILLGAAEEQFGYCVVLAALVSTPVAALMIVDRYRRLKVVMIAAAAIISVLSLGLGVQARVVADDGLIRARAWMNAELPKSSKVGLTSVTGEFALLPHEGWEVMPSLRSLQDGDAQYVLTQSRPLREGYGFAAPELLDWLQDNAQPVFKVSGPTSGDTVVWLLNRTKLQAAVTRGQILPPVTGGYP
jgi:4-amino-4-deoxy-L-arabinose transferase-like glycosyltransferase